MIFSSYQLAFFNLGPWEILLVLIVVLVLFGAKRLPELARGLGLGINEFRDAVDSSKKEIMDAVDSEDLTEKNNDSEEWFWIFLHLLKKFNFTNNTFEQLAFLSVSLY